MNQNSFIVLNLLWIVFPAAASIDARREVADWMEKNGMRHLLAAPVNVTACPDGPLEIVDDAVFIVQQVILSPQNASEPNIVITDPEAIRPSVDRLVIVTHGWLDKGTDRWPAELAAALYARTDPNQWLCGSFDWKGGSAVVSSVQAAQYGRDIAGPRLAAAVTKLNRPFTHIHLVGHSAGTWVIQSAARRLAQAFPLAVFHLTFLDAYVPNGWDPSHLGVIYDDPAVQAELCWAEHYYTKDFTMHVTEQNLRWAHNVDISALDPLVPEHEFPYRWYMATVTGRYDRWDERNTLVHSLCGCTDYGFARSLESSSQNWAVSMSLAPNKRAVVFRKPAD
ncbi:MAG: hypothetical protein LLF76_12090 [Planctomycetaceae bacterium]|nr:hypothetical protein [Planctomycetaceae bacterium]